MLKLKKSKLITLTCSITAILAVTIATPTPTANAAKLNIIKRRKIKTDIRKLQKAKNRIKELQKKTELIKKKELKTKSNISIIQIDLEKSKKKLTSSQYQYNMAHKKVMEVSKKLEKAERYWDANKDLAFQRLRRMYKDRQYSKTNSLIESQNFSMFARKLAYFNYLADKDKAILEDIKKQRKTLSDLQLEKMLQRQKEAKIAREAAVSKHQFEKQRNKQVKYLLRLKKEKAAYIREVKALEAESNKITRELQSLFVKRKKGGVKLAKTGTGRFIRPISGVPITSRFGPRTHPIFGYRRPHTGTDFGAAGGTKIKAVDSGTVISAGWRGGYGKAVLIDHGKGLVSLYGHCSAYYVRAGQTVRRGQTIAAVGSTGFSTGPHLHLEFRKNGVPVDAMKYIR